MKKITLVLALLLCATLAFTDAVEVTVDGDATMTWGIDLESTETGFQNAFSASIDFDLVSEATEELGEAAPVGYIKLADFKAVVDEDDGLTITEPSITAELLLTDALSVAGRSSICGYRICAVIPMGQSFSAAKGAPSVAISSSRPISTLGSSK